MFRGNKENGLDIKCDQPAEEQNIPVLRTRNANIRRPTCNPNFLQTALGHKYAPTNQFYITIISKKTKVKALRELTCRNKVHKRSRRTLRHIVRSRTPTPATPARYKPLGIFTGGAFVSAQTAIQSAAHSK